MANLPLANIFNRKTRTTVGILAVALGVALVLVLVGLANGSLEDITPELAVRSGFKGVVDLMKTAKHGRGESVYLVEFRYIGE